METTNFDDQPIATPEEDGYGIDPFARSLAKSIARMPSPNGVVLAIHGAWGSGKSSAISLIRHHLEHTEKAEVSIVAFNPWWFRGEEALTLAFLYEFGARMGGKKSRILRKIGRRLLNRPETVLRAVSSFVQGKIPDGVSDLFGQALKNDDTVESLHAELSKLLSEQKGRFLIVIDDIERLSPDEALQMFRLVKSVGRLPNVIYLLAFDRALAEKIVAEKYPSEGPHYLEKIIQAGFEMPAPQEFSLRENMATQLQKICGEVVDQGDVQMGNILNDVVFPEIKTPRDVIRLANMLAVSWPAVEGEVNRADFIALETLRLKQPAIHSAIRGNKGLVCARDIAIFSGFSDEQKAEFSRKLLPSVPDSEQNRYRRALARIFPPLKAVWGAGVYDQDKAGVYDQDKIAAWRNQRRACSADYFDTYFRFSLGDAVLPKAEIDEIFNRLGDEDFIAAKFREALEIRRRDGSTKAKLLLDEISSRADGEILNQEQRDAVKKFIHVIFRMGGDMNMEEDEKNQPHAGRIYYLCRNLTLKNFDINARSEIFLEIMHDAPLHWQVFFANSTYPDYHRRECHSPRPEERCLLSRAAAEKIAAEAVNAIHEAANNGSLENHSKLSTILYAWQNITDNDGAEAKKWIDDMLNRDEMVIKFAEAFIVKSTVSGGNDTVSTQRWTVQPDDMKKLFNLERFRQRLEQLKQHEPVAKFLIAWENDDRQ